MVLTMAAATKLAGILPLPAAEGAGCPAPPDERQRHADPVLKAGARPWSMAALPRAEARPAAVPLPPVTSDDRRHMIRRMTFVLSGLPPRDDDTAAFLADSSPRALEKVLDRLLAAPTAPQRLAEVWLRATGYADRWPGESAGDGAVWGEAWRYRDWLVSALRTTQDAGRLARLTMAGDALAGRGDGALVPGGALATLWHVVATPPSSDFEELVVGWSGRQAERTARVFFALDLSCARCHDHPALPLPSEEAAGMVAVFAHSHAFVRGEDGRPTVHRAAVGASVNREKQRAATAAVAAEEAKLETKRREFALSAAAEFLPQTAEYVRAAWAWRSTPERPLAAFAAQRGLLEEPLRRWATALGLQGEPPTSSLSSPWWAEWVAAREKGTPDSVAAAARRIQETHQADAESPFFSTSPSMDAFFTLDEQTQVARLASRVDALRGKVPADPLVPSLAEGPAPGMEAPTLAPTLPSLLTGSAQPTPIQPPGAGRRALATWLEDEGAPFFARLVALRLAEGLGAPLLSEPVDLLLWSQERPEGAEAVDEVAAMVQTGGWAAAAKRILLRQARQESRPPLSLGASEWRDAVLFVAEELDPRPGGAPDSSPESARRSLYREWAPLPSAPTQQFLDAQSAALAALTRRKAGSDPAVQLTYLAHRLFQRSPTASERTTLQPHAQDLPAICATLLQSEEFRVLP
jgi:hypothetical protein